MQLQIDSAEEGWGRKTGCRCLQGQEKKVIHSTRTSQEKAPTRKQIFGFRQDPGFPADVSAGDARYGKGKNTMALNWA